MCASLRASFRLIERRERVRWSAFAPLIPDKFDVMVHQFEHTIGGRAYQIEVTHVNDRWRAQIRRLPGMPTALMPFYGATPDEAAQLLSQWLTLAHRHRPS